MHVASGRECNPPRDTGRIPQFGVIFLLIVRAVRIIHADLQDSRTLKRHGVLGIVLTEAAYIGLFAGLPVVGRLLDVSIDRNAQQPGLRFAPARLRSQAKSGECQSMLGKADNSGDRSAARRRHRAGARLRHSRATDVRRDDRRRLCADRAAHAARAGAVPAGAVRVRQWRRRHGGGARVHAERELDPGGIPQGRLRGRLDALSRRGRLRLRQDRQAGRGQAPAPAAAQPRAAGIRGRHRDRQNHEDAAVHRIRRGSATWA